MRCFHLLLCTPTERTVRTAVRRLWHCSPASLRSIFNVSCIGDPISLGTPSLHTFSSSSVTPRHRGTSAYKRPALKMTSSQSSRTTLWVLQVIPKQLCSVAFWPFWHSRSSWIDSHRAQAWSSAGWSPYSSAGKRYSRCSVAYASPSFLNVDSSGCVDVDMLCYDGPEQETFEEREKRSLSLPELASQPRK